MFLQHTAFVAEKEGFEAYKNVIISIHFNTFTTSLRHPVIQDQK